MVEQRWASPMVSSTGLVSCRFDECYLALSTIVFVLYVYHGEDVVTENRCCDRDNLVTDSCANVCSWAAEQEMRCWATK